MSSTASGRSTEPPIVLIHGMNRANVKKQSQAPAATEHTEYPGRCPFPGQDGWEEVADSILAWTTGHASIAEPTAA